jgi:hypothetical protein
MLAIEHTTLVVIGTDCIGSYKPNYHRITTTIAPPQTKDRKGQDTNVIY